MIIHHLLLQRTLYKLVIANDNIVGKKQEKRERDEIQDGNFDVLPKNPLSHFFIAVNRYVINQVRLNRKGHFQEWGQWTSGPIYKVIIIELSGTHLGHHPARKEERDSLSLLYNHWWMNRMNSICVHFIDCGENLISAFKFLIHQYSSLKFHHRVRPCQHCWELLTDSLTDCWLSNRSSLNDWLN